MMFKRCWVLALLSCSTLTLANTGEENTPVSNAIPEVGSASDKKTNDIDKKCCECPPESESQSIGSSLPQKTNISLEKQTSKKVADDSWTESWESNDTWADETQSSVEDAGKSQSAESVSDDSDFDEGDDWSESWESDDTWEDEGSSNVTETDDTESDPKDNTDSTEDDSDNNTSASNSEDKDSFFSNLELKGEIAPEFRYFPAEGLQGQHHTFWSARFEPELVSKWDDGKNIFNFKYFWRQDQRDRYRTHGDIRELFWHHVIGSGWDVKLGISKVFWGVAETRHLVDIINQTDAVENLDGEAKLGQPMIRLTNSSKFGIIDGYILPFFRERTFAGENGRIRTPIRVDQDHVIFESPEKHHHMDWAVRWFKTLGAFDIGLNVFRGTARDPFFVTSLFNGELLLVPTYQIIQEYSADIQATFGNWLWKFEGLLRRGQAKTFNAQVFGFEYTFVGIFDSKVDLGVLMEYHHDKRIQNLTPFNNDIAAGFRFGFNDVNDSEILAFVLFDRNYSSQLYRIEASRRIGDSFKFNLEGTLLANVSPLDPLSFIRKDHLIQAELVYYF